MKRYWTIGIILASNAIALLAGVPHISLNRLQQEGWEKYKGQTVCVTTPLVVCGTMYDSLILSEERLFVPEEYAKGLADGDSSEYYRLKAYNQTHRIKLECKYPYSLNLGATVKGLKARVIGERHLQTGAQPRFKNYRPSKQIPRREKGSLRICAANVQNYFVHVGGYATKRNTIGQHALQCYKVASAMVKIDADLYALCELEQGDEAPQELVMAMNQLCHQEGRYAYVVTDTCDRDTISVGFIYRPDRLHPVGALRMAYAATDTLHVIYAHRFMLQGWEEQTTGERFMLSLNHPRSKRGDPVMANEKRMNNIRAILALLDDYQQHPLTAHAQTTAPEMDILLLGDYNAYAEEQPLQTLVRAGYQDMLAGMNDYSYSYKGECGFLDRCYASPSMARQITKIMPLHWNTDYYYSAAYYSKYNYKNNRIPKDKPKNIRHVMSLAAKKNRLFRYSDHDPLIVEVKTTDN